jgi:hypothetical protein
MLLLHDSLKRKGSGLDKWSYIGYTLIMTRPVRIEFEGALYHITYRGEYSYQQISDLYGLHFTTVGNIVQDARNYKTVDAD